MDNLTHTLCGLALARAGLDRTGPLVAPVLAVAANLPDLDVLIAARGHLAYLNDHRGITHALPGMGVEALLLALVAYGLGKLQGVEGLRFRPLLVASVVGLLSHLLLDLLNTYGVRPFLPFATTRFFGDAAYIVDPWLWLSFGAAAYLGTERGLRASAVWTALAGLSVVAVGASSRSAGPITGVFLLGVVLVAVAKRIPALRARPQLCALAGLALALLHVGLLLATSHFALARGRAALEPLLAGEPVVRTSASPEPGIPWRSFVAVETETVLRFAKVDLVAGTTVSAGSLWKRLDDPALRGVADTEEARTWRSFARHPFVARSAEGDLVLGDARYDAEAHESWCNLVVRRR